MSTGYSEPVETRAVVDTADLPAQPESVHFVYRLDEPELKAGALTDPGPAADASGLCLPSVIHYDGFGLALGADDPSSHPALTGPPEKLPQPPLHVGRLAGRLTLPLAPPRADTSLQTV